MIKLYLSSIKSFVILFAIVGFVTVQGDEDEGRRGGHSGGHSGGGQSGEGRGCFIAPAGTTNCTGLTGASCSNVTALTVSTKKCHSLHLSVFEIVGIALLHISIRYTPRPVITYPRE